MTEQITRAESGVLQMVKLSETPGKRYEVNEEALASVLLREEVRHLPVVVVSVVGAPRNGKSFMLNFLLRYLKASRSDQLSNAWLGRDDVMLQGFEWRGRLDSKTNGVHLWSEPIIVTNFRTGEKVVVLLMDTHCTFGAESDMIFNSTIFTLSTLMSSVQIYNLRSNITGDDLEHLQLFTKYGKLVSGEDKKAFQTLVFLVRDWMRIDKHSHGFNGGEALLNEKLQTTNNQTKELQEVRTQIRSSFEKIQCFLMPHPGFAVTEPDFKGALNDIWTDFKDQLLVFVPSLLDPDNLTPKIINEEKVQAQDWLEYFKQYVNMFNSSYIPEANATLQATAIANIMAVLREARQLYENKMKDKVKDDSVTSSMLQQWHDVAFHDAVELYRNKKKLGTHEDAEKYLDSFKKKMESTYGNYVNFVYAMVRERS